MAILAEQLKFKKTFYLPEGCIGRHVLDLFRNTPAGTNLLAAGCTHFIPYHCKLLYLDFISLPFHV